MVVFCMIMGGFWSGMGLLLSSSKSQPGLVFLLCLGAAAVSASESELSPELDDEPDDELDESDEFSSSELLDSSPELESDKLLASFSLLRAASA